MYFFLFVVKMIHFSCPIEKEVEPIQKEISVSDTYFPDLYALQLWQNLLLFCAKNTQFWVGVAISQKSFSLDDKIIASNAKAEVFFETFLFSKETWKLPLYPVARKNTQAQLFSTLRIYLNDLIFWEFFWKCSHAISRMLDVPIFLRTTQMVFGGMLVRYIVPFFQFDRNYAWSQHYFAKYIFLGIFHMTCPFAFACQNMFYSEIVQFD